MQTRSSLFQSENYKELGLVDSVQAQMNSRITGTQQITSVNSDLKLKDEQETNDPAFELAETDRKRMELLAKLRGSSEYTTRRRKEVLQNTKMFEDETKMTAVNLIEQMHEACISDYDSIKKGVAALKRFQMIEQVTELLKKKHVQEVFLEMQGCRFLEMWISQNPDGSFPPVQIVECVLDVLDRLPINQDHLESCQVARAVTQYAAVSENQLPTQLVSTATKLLQKWQTVVYQLSYEYDIDGQHEVKQRDLRRRLEVLRELDHQNSDLSKDDDLIRKTPNGFIFQKQNFDWLEKPQSTINADQTRVNSVKVSINNVFKNHKAQSMRNSRK